MDMFTMQAKLGQCLIAQTPWGAVDLRWSFSDWQHVILNGLLEGTFNTSQFIHAMVASGFTEAARINCLIDAFAPAL